MGLGSRQAGHSLGTEGTACHYRYPSRVFHLLHSSRLLTSWLRPSFGSGGDGKRSSEDTRDTEETVRHEMRAVHIGFFPRVTFSLMVMMTRFPGCAYDRRWERHDDSERPFSLTSLHYLLSSSTPGEARSRSGGEKER